MSRHPGPFVSPVLGAPPETPGTSIATNATVSVASDTPMLLFLIGVSSPYPWTSVVSDPWKVHGGAPDLPATVIVITRLWMPRPFRYVISFCRSNFAVPTPFVTVHAMFWKRGSLETSASAILVIRTLDPITWATLRPGMRMSNFTVFPVELRGSGSGSQSAIAVYDVAGVHACGSLLFGMPSPS